MKAVQIGILAALLVVAGLLVKVYQGQQAAAPAVEAAPAQTAALPPAAEAPAAEPVAPAEPAASTGPATEPAPAPAVARRPSPSRKTERKAPAEIAQNRRPVPPVQVEAPAPPAPAPAVQAPPPAAAPEPQQPVNPPAQSHFPPPPPPEPRKVTIPAGSNITVRLAETLSTDKNQPGESFSATLDQPLIIDGLAVAERGSKLEGKIVEAAQAGRVKGVSSLAIQLMTLHTSDGQRVPIKTASFVKEGVASKGDDIKKVGLGAALGAAIGAIAGGGKGAGIGAAVGGAAGGGTVLATRGKPAELPVETRVTFRLEQAVTLTEKLD